MNVLSLFDGISCGMVALERAGIKIDGYYASEIDSNAIAISEKKEKAIFLSLRMSSLTSLKRLKVRDIWQ